MSANALAEGQNVAAANGNKGAKGGNAVADKAKQIADQIASEKGAIATTGEAYLVSLVKAGYEVVNLLGLEMADAANVKTGRTHFGTWYAFMGAMSLQQHLTAKQRQAILTNARNRFRERVEDNNQIPADVSKIVDRFVKASSKPDGMGGIAFRMALAKPAAVEIAFGE